MLVLTLPVAIIGPRGCDLPLLAFTEKFWDRAAREL